MNMQTTHGLRVFLDSLSPGSGDTDRFSQLVQQLMQRGSEDSLERLEQRQKEVHDKINHKNQERSRLKALRDNLDHVLKMLDDQISSGNRAADIILFRILLQQERFRVHSEVVHSNPTELMEERACLREEIQQRRQISDLIGSITEVRRGIHG